jgi:iron(III) transport system substrate-binding protein
MGILINTRLVKGRRRPKSWDDLNSPKWKGKLLSDDMRPARQRQHLVRGAAEQHGRRIQRKAGRAESRLQPRYAQRRPPRRPGEYPIYITQVFRLCHPISRACR